MRQAAWSTRPSSRLYALMMVEAGAMRRAQAPIRGCSSWESIISSSLHRACEQALHEVALEGEEHEQRDDQRHEGCRGDDVDVRAELAQLREDVDGDRCRV